MCVSGSIYAEYEEVIARRMDDVIAPRLMRSTRRGSGSSPAKTIQVCASLWFHRRLIGTIASTSVCLPLFIGAGNTVYEHFCLFSESTVVLNAKQSENTAVTLFEIRV